MAPGNLPVLQAAFPDYSRRCPGRARSLLPGDSVGGRANFRVHIPVTTSILASPELAVLFLHFGR
jgi:hypothetical protein